ncbi:T9SS type A sorting domain-containing protein [Flavobacterium salmonis]|uniref:Secretion system C-terminal sorting domain-containing protein n=1 Tax=Flavobacterium salmonis TaxID=2654844 RepID=A0A6V6YSH2_9FLAO|nr:T9SS type A sorting domain-containing protein [Flavobacterium salmonis]CAD0002239.1 hypothetical protein FLAT13_00999 [Flavobacterium salmonis]
MKQKLLLLSCFLSGFANYAQNDCTETNKQAQTYLLGTADAKPDYTKAYAIVQNCANQGDASSLAISGIMRLNGLGIEKDENLAFEYLMKAALQGHPSAEYNIGRFYMIGTGCDIDFDKAIYWLTLASDHGDEQAAYSIGYMYLKGLGVPQDYKKAISWFEISSWPMAKHWLGNCYYFGYGVPKDENKAILYYTQSHTGNSEQLLKHIAQNVKENVDTAINNELKEKETPENTGIAKEAIDKLAIETLQQTENRTLKSKYLNGKWKGKLIELDWSGKQIMKVLPLNSEFSAQDNTVNYKWEINKTTSQSIAIWEDNALYFDKLNMVFDWPFSDRPDVNTIDWEVLSAQIEFKVINNKTYLIGNLQTFTNQWNEPGPPMRVILKQTGEGEEDDLTDDELLAISDQKDHFIVLYPNPFVEDVFIAYELDKEAQVSVNVYDLTGNPVPAILEPGALQTAGKHHYTLSGGNLKAGMYIVRVGVGNEMHSRILIKK